MARRARSAPPAADENLLSELRPGLRALLKAWQFSQDAQQSPWEFAVEIAALHHAGLTDNDLRWLLHKRYAEHAAELKRAQRAERVFGKIGSGRFTAESCFVLTAAGAERILRIDAAAQIPRPSRIQVASKAKPVWDPVLRELRYQGQVVKRFRVPAPNQELILSAFQEERWPPRIDDPLPPCEEIDPKKRLNAVIQSLNRCQINRLIHFGGNGEADGVVWKVLAVVRERSSVASNKAL